MLVKHLRDALNVPFGTMVAIDRDTIGVTIHSKSGFNKKDGVRIAAGRAEKNPGLDNIHIPHVFLFDGYDYTLMSDIVHDEYERMMERARRYFK